MIPDFEPILSIVPVYGEHNMGYTIYTDEGVLYEALEDGTHVNKISLQDVCVEGSRRIRHQTEENYEYQVIVLRPKLYEELQSLRALECL